MQKFTNRRTLSLESLEVRDTPTNIGVSAVFGVNQNGQGTPGTSALLNVVEEDGQAKGTLEIPADSWLVSSGLIPAGRAKFTAPASLSLTGDGEHWRFQVSGLQFSRGPMASPASVSFFAEDLSTPGADIYFRIDNPDGSTSDWLYATEGTPELPGGTATFNVVSLDQSAEVAGNIGGYRLALTDMNGYCTGTLTNGHGQTVAVMAFEGFSSYDSGTETWSLNNGTITSGQYAGFTISITANDDTGDVHLVISGLDTEGNFITPVDATGHLRVNVEF